MSVIRQRKNLEKFIQEFDAFPKVEEDHQEKTASGGGLSLLVFALITMLVFFEVKHYMDEGVRYQYDIDPHFDKKLKLNIDIMVAMKCSDIGADILDITGENADKFGNLEEEDVHFELSPQQQRRFEGVRAMRGHAKEEYHLVHGNLWRQLRHSVKELFSYHKESNPGQADGCRFHGSLEVNKVAGNFHITAGKSVNIGSNHMHISFDDESTALNFSHRIIQFSFGDSDTGILNPLDAEVKTSNDPNHIWQYFLQVVPTTASSIFHGHTDMYQYAVTEQNRTISHNKGSHGMPGIFVKYDLSPIRVKLEDGSSTLVQLVVRLCGIVGGVFATSSFFHLIVSGLVDVICCRWGSNTPSSSSPPPSSKPYTTLINHEIPNNDAASLLNNNQLSSQLVSLVAVPSDASNGFADKQQLTMPTPLTNASQSAINGNTTAGI